MDLTLTSLLPILGVGLGWMLNEFGTRRRTNLEARRRVYDIKLEAWRAVVSSMETVMSHWTARTAPEVGNLGLTWKKLLLLETDPESRRLIQDIQDSLPDEGSEDHDVLGLAMSYDPIFDRQHP